MHLYRYKIVTVLVSSVIRMRWEYVKIQWIKQVLDEFVPSNEFKKPARFAASAVKFWKRDSSSALEKEFPRGLGHFCGCSTSSKRCVLVHKNSLASCQRCRHSVEPHALTCPFKQSNLSSWSLLSWHPTHEYLCGRICFFQIRCLLSTVTLTLRFVIWHFRNTVWYNCVVGITQYWISNHFHHQSIGRQN